MFDAAFILASVRAGVIEPEWFVMSAQRTYIVWRLATFIAGIAALEFIGIFICFGAFSTIGASWLAVPMLIALSLGIFWWFRQTLRLFYRDVRTWAQQKVVITPEGFLIASSGAIKPRFAAAFAEVSSIKMRPGKNQEGSVTHWAVVVRYHTGHEAVIDLDHRFGSVETIANACSAAHQWYERHAAVA